MAVERRKPVLGHNVTLPLSRHWFSSLNTYLLRSTVSPGEILPPPPPYKHQTSWKILIYEFGEGGIFLGLRGPKTKKAKASKTCINFFALIIFLLLVFLYFFCLCRTLRGQPAVIMATLLASQQGIPLQIGEI